MPGIGVRSLPRDVFIYEGKGHSTLLGGLTLTTGITQADIYVMIEIFVAGLTEGYRIENDTGDRVPRDEEPLTKGNYHVVAESPIWRCDTRVLLRTISRDTGPRLEDFRRLVRARDGGCVVTKRANAAASAGLWLEFAVAHIFPLAYEGEWNRNNYGRWIKDPQGSSTGGLINSVQNGLVLSRSIQAQFDCLNFSINPDVSTYQYRPWNFSSLSLSNIFYKDGFKIVCFSPDSFRIAGTRLDPEWLAKPDRPPDELFRWHFRQAVLCNVRGIGEPTFEHDFPLEGPDPLEDIWAGPLAAERMEFELFSRFGAQMELSEGL